MLRAFFMIDPSAIQHAFADNFAERDELGASLSVWHQGSEILSLHGGHRERNRPSPWTPDTLVLWWSATKGPASACVLRALAARDLEPGTRVAEFWPEFGAAGKQHVTVGQLLSHQAGIPALDPPIPPALDHAAMAECLAAQKPFWTPGDAHGYHPRTFGYLAEECVRRLTGGRTLSGYWRKEIADPMEIDFWIGLPAELDGRVAPIYPARTITPPEDEAEFYREFNRKESLVHRAFTTGVTGAISGMNRPELRGASLPAIGGIGSAQGLAKFYALLAGDGTWQGRRYFSETTLGWMRRPLVNGPDRVFLFDTSFSCGFMLDPVNPDGTKSRSLFGPSLSAFGHPGAGGSHAFADPERGLAFAYGMNQMSLASLPHRRALPLVEALYASLPE